MIDNYVQLHCHSDGSNIITPDVPTTCASLVARAKELGQTSIALTDHGSNVKKYDFAIACKKHNIKPIFGIEAYYVKDVNTTITKQTTKGEQVTPDDTNAHLIILAKNHNGYKQINLLMSDSWEFGFYRKPRIDDAMILKHLNPNDVIITTACIGGVLAKYPTDQILTSFSRFISAGSFYLEIHAHDNDKQKQYNKKILSISNTHSIPIVYANDTHVIHDTDTNLRDAFLKTKGIVYEEELDGKWFVDYPSYREVVFRLKSQGILNEAEIASAISNTHKISDSCEQYSIISYNIQVPVLKKYKHLSFEERHQALLSIINNNLASYLKDIDPSLHSEYHAAVEFETNELFKAKVSDYFLFNYYMVKLAIEKYGGVLTKTSRGSASCYLTNFLLGFTAMDKLKFKQLPLFAERFLTAERLLSTNSLPDYGLYCC